MSCGAHRVQVPQYAWIVIGPLIADRKISHPRRLRRSRPEFSSSFHPDAANMPTHSLYIPLKPPPLGRLRRNFGASWGRNVALGSVLGANLRQIGVKIWLLGHLRGEDSPRGWQGTSKGQPSKNSPCARGPFWPENCNFHIRFGVPFWVLFLLNFGSHF